MGLFLLGIIAVFLGFLVAFLVEPLGVLLIQVGVIAAAASFLVPLLTAVVYVMAAIAQTGGRQPRTNGDGPSQPARPRREDLDLDTGSIEDYRR
jgi:hypothetical protein